MNMKKKASVMSVVGIRFLKYLSRTGLCLLLLAALVSVSVCAAAETAKPGAGEHREQMVSDMAARLDLTEDQQAKVLSIFEKSDEERRQIFKKYNGTGDRESVRSEMDQIRQNTDAQLATVLSESQMSEFREFMEEKRDQRRSRMQGGMSGEMPPNPPGF